MERITEIGSITLDTARYRLARTEARREWSESSEHEPPWQGGLPAMLSEPQETWHLGGLKSRQGLPGTSEYGKNTDTRFPFRLLPGPKVVTVDLGFGLLPLGATPTSIFEAMGFIWVVLDSFVYRIDPSDDSALQVQDFGPNIKGIMGLKWEDDVGLVTTDEETKSLWKVTLGAFQEDAFDGGGFQAGGIGWQQTADVVAYRLAGGINRLFKVNKTGELRNILSGKDPLVEANYSDEIQCGDKTPPPTGLVSYERTAFVGKAEGLFGVGTDGFGVSLIKRVVRESTNGLGMVVYDPYVIYPHSRGVIRFTPGLVESVGIEQETMNESPVQGPFRAFAPDQQWMWGALQVGGEFYILWAKEQRSLGPLTWDTWVFETAAANISCEAMLVSALTSPPRLWFGHGGGISYIKLSTGVGAPDPSSSGYEFALSGSRFSVKYRFGDWGSKDFPKITVVGKNLTAARFWEVSYSVDGGAFSNLDKDGNVMRIDSDGRKTFFLPTTVVGREIQFRYDYTGDVATQAGELNFAEGFAVLQSRKIATYTVQLYLAEGVRHDEEVEARTGIQQFNDLALLEEKVDSVVGNGPWGDTQVWVRGKRLIEVVQEGGREPEFLVEVVLQKRETV